MPNPYFAFKQFTIYHDKCGMKVGTDGVLLGAWVNLAGVESILDVGTGTGLIALMCAQRSANTRIDAVEIDKDASTQAIQNVNASPWTGRIHIYHDSFQHFAETAKPRYDLIVSNPPFFRNSLRPPGPSRALARHDDRLSFESLMHDAVPLLQRKGRLAVITPASAFEQFAEQASLYHLHICKQTYIRPMPGKNYSRCLAEFSQEPHSCDVTAHELIIREGNTNSYSENYIALTQAFYLNL